MKKVLFAVTAVLLVAPLSLKAQTPAGSTGQCKDGSYTSVTSKSGACRGHKGIQTWYAAAPAAGAKASAAMPAAKTAAPATPVAAKPVTATPAPTPAVKPTTPAPAMAAAPAAKTAPAAKSTSAKTPAPGGGPGMVWVNTSSKVYHCPGGEDYGTTKAGKYMSEADAKASGAHAAYNKPCSTK